VGGESGENGAGAAVARVLQPAPSMRGRVIVGACLWVGAACSSTVPGSGTDGTDGSTGGEAATGEVGTTGGDSDSTSASTGAVEETEGTSEGGTETDTDVDPPVVPPTVSEACDDPVASIVDTLAAADGQRFDGIALAYDGSATLLAYAESTSFLTWTVWRQLLDDRGMAIGSREQLGTVSFPEAGVQPQPRPWVTVASIGSDFVACWTSVGAPQGIGGDPSITCAAVGDDGTIVPGMEAPGQHPAVALGPAGIGLVYVQGDAFVSRRLGPDAVALDAPHTVFTVGGGPVEIRPALAGSAAEYVAAADLLLPRFDASFAEIEGASVVGWTSLPVSVAGSSDVIAAAWGSLEGVRVRVRPLADEEFSGDVRIDGLDDGTSAATTHVTRAEGSFAVVWSVDASLMYAAIDLEGQPIGDAVEATALSWRSDALAATGVASGFTAAAATSVAQDELAIVSLTCP
jgi:hypothetical protein